ncbi:MAG: thioredoxin family protein [Candidatus Thorarchaeota archaeon]|jgi:glutaredoxin|nr:thioredoxin family protein [Candidatus Thorarchaeota archaeon]
MILLFTSPHCAWCDVVKDMVETECDTIGGTTRLHEVDVERHTHIAETYGVLTVPTLVSGSISLSGVPCSDDLRSFLFQSIAGRPLHKDEDARSILRSARYSKNQSNGRRPLVKADSSSSENARDKEHACTEPSEASCRH